MKDEKSDNDSPSGSLHIPLTGPTGLRSAFEGLPIRDKFNALSYFCDVTAGRANEGGPLLLKSEGVRQSAFTCMRFLSALASLLEHYGTDGSDDTAGRR